MNAADVFVFPSLYEGFGLPVLEAMASGVPVVAANGGSVEEVGGSAPVYVDPQSAEDIARGIAQVLTDTSLREQKIKLGFDRIGQFSWVQAGKETLSLFS